MRLKDPEVDTIVNALLSVNPSIATMRAALAGLSSTELIAAVSEGASPASDLRGILDHLDQRDPRTLLKILKAYEANSQDLLFVARVYERALPDPTRDPWIERLLWKRSVVLDRGPLRTALKMLHEAERPNVLLITGETKSGKSKSADLVQHIATTHGHPYVCVLGTGELGAAVTAEQILLQLGAEAWEVEPVPSPDSHWYRKQCSRIFAAGKAALRQQNVRRFWVVLDEIGPETGTVVELCDHLMQLLAPTTMGMRLVLIGYPRIDSPQAIPAGAIEWDRLVYGTIRAADVRDYLLWLHGELAGKPLTEEALTSELQSLLGGLDPSGAEFLKALGPSLEARTRAALAGVP
ncbi:hypothetical protein WME95_03765 [Sorangium sp. So ce327]|uniref:hypothetical protein n=1 Tax=Sorangium sp. So ce327 TaxID=3133301 RepID=UPI003F61CCC0